MSWFSKKQDPKEDIEEDLIEINRLYDREKHFACSGNRDMRIIQEYHKREAIHTYKDKHGETVTWDSKSDRYTLRKGQ